MNVAALSERGPIRPGHWRRTTDAVLEAGTRRCFAVFVTVTHPMDPEVGHPRRAVQSRGDRGEDPPAGLDEKGVEDRRVLPFSEPIGDEEIVEWTSDEYIKIVYEVIEPKLAG